MCGVEQANEENLIAFFIHCRNSFSFMYVCCSLFTCWYNLNDYGSPMLVFASFYLFIKLMNHRKVYRQFEDTFRIRFYGQVKKAIN